MYPIVTRVTKPAGHPIPSAIHYYTVAMGSPGI